MMLGEPSTRPVSIPTYLILGRWTFKDILWTNLGVTLILLPVMFLGMAPSLEHHLAAYLTVAGFVFPLLAVYNFLKFSHPVLENADVIDIAPGLVQVNGAILALPTPTNPLT